MPQVRTRIRRPAPVSEALEQIGGRIRKARTEAGLSQAQLGAPHFTRAYVSAIELGKVRPAMKSLDFLADKLGKPASYFIEDADADRRRKGRELEIRSAEALLSRQTAAQAIQRARPLLESAASAGERCRLHLILGTAHNLLIEGNDALRELAAADRLQQSASGAMGLRIRYQTALAFRHSGNSLQAIAILRQLLSDLDAAKVRDMPLRLRVVKDLGVILIDSGDYEEANSYLLTALEWAQDIGDVSGLVSIYNALGYAYRALGDLDAATGYIQRALASNEALQDLTATAMFHNTLAVIAAERQHFQASTQHIERAIQIARASGPAFMLPHYICTKAECELKEGKLEAAQSDAMDALVNATKVDNQRAAASAKLVLAEIAAVRGQQAEGEAQLEEAAALYKTLGAKAELGETYIRLSRSAGKRGDTKRAQKYSDLAYKVTKKTSGLVER
ncbi:MAG TPA: tetratricopeptide repeat protein [Candidatus Limnocylindria bacterium]|nr:tetratricopeptide repeat protein [Candidatus Limnocylindria bacterium]